MDLWVAWKARKSDTGWVEVWRGCCYSLCHVCLFVPGACCSQHIEYQLALPPLWVAAVLMCLQHTNMLMCWCTHPPMHPHTDVPVHPCANAPMHWDNDVLMRHTPTCNHMPMHPCTNVPNIPTHSCVKTTTCQCADTPPSKSTCQHPMPPHKCPCTDMCWHTDTSTCLHTNMTTSIPPVHPHAHLSHVLPWHNGGTHFLI